MQCIRAETYSQLRELSHEPLDKQVPDAVCNRQHNVSQVNTRHTYNRPA